MKKFSPMDFADHFSASDLKTCTKADLLSLISRQRIDLSGNIRIRKEELEHQKVDVKFAKGFVGQSQVNLTSNLKNKDKEQLKAIFLSENSSFLLDIVELEGLQNNEIQQRKTKERIFGFLLCGGIIWLALGAPGWLR